ncbi:MAG: TetR family transcriptional regulator C-terminal domain-containing protein [Halobacteriales archaeon]|nr:TetR family transcriptional regulator C-terminal domain-containing protein [Halobacteriales archaeon]
MAPPALFDDEPASTREAIMEATYRALCTHGYADLTIQKIGDEFTKSKSLVYHHYDGKDELLLDFLEFMLERFEADVIGDGAADAADHLEALLDHVVPETLGEDRAAFRRAMIALRAQAAHDDAYRDHFSRSDALFHDHLAGLIERGVEDGSFREVDPDRVASFLLTAIDGAMLRRATTDNEAAARETRRELDAYLAARLLADDR